MREEITNIKESSVKTKRDIWSEWLLNRRFGGDAKQMKSLMELFLYPVREKVLNNAKLGENETLLDVGCGDGLISFGAFEKSESVKVIFSDISQDILTHDELVAKKLGVFDRCRFVCTQAENLSSIDDESVEVVTARSVLIYIKDKQKVFNEFYRALKPGGRLSLFEPINKYTYIEPANCFWGYNVEPVVELAGKVKAVFDRSQPPENDPMLDFDERDLIMFAEKIGFKEIHLELLVDNKPKDDSVNWEILLRTAFNPELPTLEEAMKAALTPVETEKFVKHLLPLVEAHKGTTKSTVAYLWAIK